MSEHAPVLVSRAENVLTITINRPEARNAVDQAVAAGIGDALEEAEQDRDIRAVIVTGAGEQSFCAGADLKALARGEQVVPQDAKRRQWGFAGFVSHPIGKPIVAAVNGTALGGGTEIALASDIVVACEGASFGLPEVKRGIIAAAGGVFRLPRQISPKIAMEMILTGEPISAERALALGLINHVVPRDSLLETARAIAARIAANAPLAVQASKRIAVGVQNGAIADELQSWQLTRNEARVIFSSHDMREGTRAFAEKRAPNWTAR